mgnify:CR=1 FL=1
MRRLTGLIVLLFCIQSFSYAQLSTAEFIVNSTIKLEIHKSKTENGKLLDYTVSGTGFFFEFSDEGSSVPVIVTNAHVVDSLNSIVFYFKQRSSDGKPLYNSIERVNLEKENLKWIRHPDPKVDLAVLPLAPLVRQFQAKHSKQLFFAAYEEKHIPNDSVANSLSAIEEILMVGYPHGIRDVYNDLPVVRRGITATPFNSDYNSKEEFLCDLSVSPGSSGSPVLVFNPSSFTDKYGNLYMKSRFLFLGISHLAFISPYEATLSAEKDSSGKVIANPSRITTSIPFNIAVAIKSKKLLDFKPLLRSDK